MCSFSWATPSLLCPTSLIEERKRRFKLSWDEKGSKFLKIQIPFFQQCSPTKNVVFEMNRTEYASFYLFQRTTISVKSNVCWLSGYCRPQVSTIAYTRHREHRGAWRNGLVAQFAHLGFETVRFWDRAERGFGCNAEILCRPDRKSRFSITDVCKNDSKACEQRGTKSPVYYSDASWSRRQLAQSTGSFCSSKSVYAMLKTNNWRCASMSVGLGIFNRTPWMILLNCCSHVESGVNRSSIG